MIVYIPYFKFSMLAQVRSGILLMRLLVTVQQYRNSCSGTNILLDFSCEATEKYSIKTILILHKNIKNILYSTPKFFRKLYENLTVNFKGAIL